MEQHDDGSRWRLCWARQPNRPYTARSDVLADFPDLAEREAALGIRSGQPFLLMPDGRPDVDVLEFFRSAAFQSLAAGSQESYAPTSSCFCPSCPFKASTGERPHSSILPTMSSGGDATNRTRIALVPRRFHETWRRSRSSTTGSSGVATWASPVALHKPSSTGDSDSTRLQPNAVRSVQLKWLTPRAYKRWRDVGLGGYRSDGRRDATWRGRNDGRNLAFAEALWSSGLRLREAGTLVLGEIPSADNQVRYAKARVGCRGEGSRPRFLDQRRSTETH